MKRGSGRRGKSEGKESESRVKGEGKEIKRSGKGERKGGESARECRAVALCSECTRGSEIVDIREIALQDGPVVRGAGA